MASPPPGRRMVTIACSGSRSRSSTICNAAMLVTASVTQRFARRAVVHGGCASCGTVANSASALARPSASRATTFVSVASSPLNAAQTSVCSAAPGVAWPTFCSVAVYLPQGRGIDEIDVAVHDFRECVVRMGIGKPPQEFGIGCHGATS